MKRLDFSQRNIIWKHFFEQPLKKKKLLVCSLLVSCLLRVFDSPDPGCLACMRTAHMGLIKARLKSEGASPLALLGAGMTHAVDLLICRQHSETGFCRVSVPTWL